MMSMPYELAHEDNNPLDLIEEFATGKGWTVLREDDAYLLVKMPGQDATYDAAFEWQEEFSALLFTCTMPLKIDGRHYEAAVRALEQINQHLWLGHFDLSGDKEGAPVFRHTMLMRMIPSGIAVDLAADLADLAVAECNRFHSTFQMLQSGDVRLQDNLSAVVFETVGEA